MLEQHKLKIAKSRHWIVFILCYLLILLNNAVLSATAQHTIKSLPGFNGTLPFKLETGYVGVGENDESQLFYYFIESESDPKRDPLVLWLTGGLGCSGFSGLVYEIGPLAFDYEAFDGNLPSFIINKYSWTKVANIIFLDYPAGTGFSYATKAENYSTNDTKITEGIYIFLRKWLLNHPNFSSNPLYIAGDSYIGGKVVPMLALEIDKANEAGLKPRMSLKGYIVGNGVTNSVEDNNERLPFAHRMGLVSDEYFELAKKSCNGDYMNPDPDNIQCKYALHLCSKCTRLINIGHVLEPTCRFLSPKHKNGLLEGDAISLFADYESDRHLLALSRDEDSSWCRNYNYLPSYIWADDETVREALHIRKGTKTSWERCNKTLPYEANVESVLEHHQLLSKKGYRALIYSGDQDMIVPYMSTLKWIRALNITLDEDWRAWTVNGQVAGYTMKYKKNEAALTFATVKGAGHTAPEYKPEQCLAMFSRWLSTYPL